MNVPRKMILKPFKHTHGFSLAFQEDPCIRPAALRTAWPVATKCPVASRSPTDLTDVI